jgi:flagellar hook-associated protein 3 FlgL
VRIATAHAYQNAIDSMTERQAKLVRNQEELSTGKKLLAAGDDPVAAAAAERTRSAQRRIELQQRMNDFATAQLQIADGALSSVGDVLQLVREGVVQAGNGGYSASDRHQIATQLRGYREELLALANRPDGAGGFLFGGQGSQTAPFADGASVTYLAQPGEQEVGLDATSPTVLDGRQTFMDLPNGAGTQSIFDLIDRTIAVLDDPASTGVAVSATVRDAISGLDVAMDRVSTKRTEVGEGLRALEARDKLSADGSLQLSSQLSKLVDVDYAKAISEFQNNQTALSAAMRTYAQISKMSLFDYL